MISSISLRLPQKTCGLFDTGFAGDACDAASFDLSVPADIDQSLFTFGEVSPTALALSEGSSALSATVDHEAALKTDIPSTSGLMEWNYDVLNPLSGLDDPLADDSLDAFVNLDSIFMEHSFFDSCSLSTTESAEVKPVIALPEADTSVHMQTVPAKTHQALNKPATKPSRKRKAQASVAPVETSLFKIQEEVTAEEGMLTTVDSQVDHDYIVKGQGMSSASKINSNKGSGTAKRKKVSSTALDDSIVSTSTSFEFVEPDTPFDKQTVRRMKNNVASKRSREQRKQKFVEMDHEAEKLIVENDRLRNKIVELEKLAKEMKELLVAKMAGKA